MNPAAVPSAPSAEAEAFYAECLHLLGTSGIPFLLSGTYALSAYTGITRPTKDLDLVCKPGDVPRILALFRNRGDEIEIEDERWIAKVRRGELFIDLIFACASGTAPVNQSWFDGARSVQALGVDVRIASPTDMIYSKAFIQLRHRYDGADVAHLLLRQHAAIDWHRLLLLMEGHWEVLLMHILNFRWIYPSERDHVPRWLLDELLQRLHLQLDLPPPQMKICRGRMFSHIDYAQDVREWGFGDVGGEGEWRRE